MKPIELDVRPILRSGGEPFGAIMAVVRDLAAGQSLRLIAPFRPDPLMQVLGRQGFASEPRQIEGGDWEVTFSPVRAADDLAMPVDPEAPVTWPQPLAHVDCGGLDAAAILARIKAALAPLRTGDVLFTLTDGAPLELFDDLEAGGHAWYGQFDEQGVGYQLMILKGPQA